MKSCWCHAQWGSGDELGRRAGGSARAHAEQRQTGVTQMCTILRDLLVNRFGSISPPGGSLHVHLCQGRI